MPTSSTKVFPYWRYVSTVVVYCVILLSSVLILPHIVSVIVDLEPDSEQLSSLDKPQHPFLVPLTAKPVFTVTYAVVAALVLQIWWARCLIKWDARSVAQGRTTWHRSRDATAAAVVMSVVFHIVLLLFGAPINHHVLRTHALASLLSVLICFTPAYVFGNGLDMNSRVTFIRLFVLFKPINEVETALAYPAYGTLVGCWAGAFPIALDWDRPWQAWPLTTAFGSVLGHILGQLFTILIVGYQVFFAQPVAVSAKATKSN